MVLAVSLAGCRSRQASAAPRAPGARSTATPKVVERLYADGYQGGWRYFGWADELPKKGSPIRLNMSNYGGWIINHPSLKGRFGGLVLRFKAPVSYGDFLEVRLDSEMAELERVALAPRHRKDLPDGWTEAFVSMAELNPDLLPFGQVVVRARSPIPAPGEVAFDQVGLTEFDPSLLPKEDTGPGKPATFVVDCAAPTQPISPLIYGIAYSARHEYTEEHQWKLGATARRWGGNPTSRYNWQLGNAWNAGVDWFFENLNYTGRPNFTWEDFLLDNRERGALTALTVPTLGWVAKDTRSVSFPVSEFGTQQSADEGRGAGNGLTAAGKPIPPGPPTRTSVAATPEFVGAWVKAIKRLEAEKGTRLVHQYILDNEPALWHDTHRDVHPQPLTYDELLERTVAYGSAVRKADPQAVIAGPAEWGWPAYFYSAADGVAGFHRAPDRKAHQDIPLIEWYLRKLAEHEKKTGVRVLDVLDVHFYPQAKGIGVGLEGRTDRETNALRLRTTRGLWDPSYVDESWIKEPVRLIPRMREWVDRNYPGLKLSLGEYSFGAERHMSGGLALAEALGRFGQNGLFSAFYWTYPPERAPAFWAFRAYRNYDGKGAAFEALSMPTQAPPNTALFAARSQDLRRVTLVLLNHSPTETLEATVTMKGCPAVTSRRAFTYTGGPDGFGEAKAGTGGTVRVPRYSINVVELSLEHGATK